MGGSSRFLTRREFLGAGVVGIGTMVAVLRSPEARGTYRRSLGAMGTKVRLVIDGAPPGLADLAAAAAFDEVRAVERLMSTHDPNSDLSRVNRWAGRETVRVDDRVLEVVRAGLEAGRATGGAFDVTTLPLLRAWGFRDYRFDRPPTAEDLDRARERVGAGWVVAGAGTLGLLREGAGLDLGGIAKGYAVDRAVAALRGLGIERALVEAGGDLVALGRPLDEEGWEIALRDPRGEGVLATFRLADAAVATSGATESYVTWGAARYGHLMDPHTGRPADGPPSVSVLAPTGTVADAHATAQFVRFDPATLPEGGGWLRVEARGADLALRSGGAFPPTTRVAAAG